jgi:protein-tyrosine phosphatase
VVFVCTGNTCRSPLAEVFLKKSLATRLGCALSDLPAHGWRIDSAGIHARDGQPASAAAHAAAQTRGLSLEGHRSRLLRPEELADADDLIALGRSHREAIRAWREGACVRLLHTDGVDIADPFGGPREVYEACAREIQQHVDHLAEQLLQSEAIPPVAELRQQAGFPHE